MSFSERLQDAQSLLAELWQNLRRFPWRTTALTLRERFREDRLGVTAADFPRIIAASRNSSMKTNPLVLTDAEIEGILALRLACLFHRNRAPLEVPLQDASQRERRFEIRLSAAWLKRYPLTAAALRSEIREWRSVGFELRIPALDGLDPDEDPTVD